MTKPATMLAGVLFLLGAFIHGYRLYAHFSVVVANYVIPLWFSWGGVAVGLILGVMLLREARR
ncbi:MAG TPA: hypothetical protein VN154_07930 [Rhizomicrobium sp.]|nr:hypothetical protein [Rhizomicrobium sp.]